MKRALLLLAMLALIAPAYAKPAPKRGTKAKTSKVAKRAVKTPLPATKKGAAARITIGKFGELRPAREVVGRREEPLTPEEETAKEIAKLLRGPLRKGVTGLFVADARTGQPLFAVNADETMNPASNVKMLSTATALDLLGPEFRYPTRLLGPDPINGVIKGDVYLLGSYDPTLTAGDLDDIAAAVSARGITSIEGNILVGTDPTRDGIFRAVIPIEIAAGEPGAPAIATVPIGAEHVVVDMQATTAKRAQRSRLKYKVENTKTDRGIPRIIVTVTGTIGKDRETMYPLWTKARTTTAAYALRASLRAHAINVGGDLAFSELGDFIGDAVAKGGLPVELGRHESRRLADIVSRVNKFSVNWLSDRVIMTAAALTQRTQPSMKLAIEAMYAWLERHTTVDTKNFIIDTGSGLSYKTRIAPIQLVKIIRAAGGFLTEDSEPELAQAWLDSLSIARKDGTLRHRVRQADVRARIRGKSGTLSTVIAMSGILEIDPDRPLAFSLVTNTDRPLSKRAVRLAHDKVMGTLCNYLAKTSRTMTPVPLNPPIPENTPMPDSEGTEETEPDEELDAEAAGQETSSVTPGTTRPETSSFEPAFVPPSAPSFATVSTPAS